MPKLAVLALIAAIGFLGWPAHADTWPERPVKIMVPFAAGGPSDSMARITAEDLSAALGQTFVVENEPGAGGAIAGATVVRAASDGYTLYWATPGQITILPAIAKLSYDPTKDLLPITAVGENRFGLVVNPKTLPVATIGQFIDFVRAQPGKIAFASAGAGTITHLAMELLARRANLRMIGIPYKGIAPAFTDVIAGHVPTMFASLADAIEQDKGGTVKLLAVSSRDRVSTVPDVPTVSESGVPGFHIVSWNGLMAPFGTPRVVIERIADEIGRAARTPAFAERLTRLGFAPVGSTPQEFAAAISAEIPIWMEAVRSAGLKPR